MITIRTISVGAKRLAHDPATVVTVATNTSTPLLPDESQNYGLIEYRTIQNIGGNNLYYTVNGDCNGAADCSGYLVPGAQLDCSHYQRVTGYSTGGTTVAVTVARISEL
jgi:hypothetical protein